jgi:drug/metabolite transporter (DMT)-like permease
MKRSYLTGLMLLAMLIWGGSWVAGKVVSGAASPDIIVFVRFLISFIAFLPFFPWIRPHLRMSVPSLLMTAVCAAVLVLYNQFFFMGLRAGFAGSGSVIVTTLSPILTFALSSVLFRKKFTTLQSLGLFLGFASGICIVAPWRLHLATFASSAVFFFAACALIWAMLTIMSQRLQRSASAIGYSFYLFLFTALIQLPFCAKSELMALPSMGLSFWANIFFLGALASTFSNTVYFLASRRIGAGRASSFMFVVPLCAVVLSALILKETPSPSTLGGGCAAVIAVWLINRKVK